jgi:hypothetical protein
MLIYAAFSAVQAGAADFSRAARRQETGSRRFPLLSTEDAGPA